MNKDTVVASIIGFGLGLVAAIALWVVPRILPKTPATQPQKEEVLAQKTESSPKNEAISFSISEPADGEITTTKSIKIVGTAPQSEIVIITTAGGNLVVTPKDDGKFEDTLNLKDGVNEIVISSYAKDKPVPEEKHVTVFLSEDQI